MTFIKEYIATLQNDGLGVGDVGRVLGVSSPMVSAYKNQNYNPSLDVAKKVWKDSEIALHPFSGTSLEHEITKDGM